MCFQLFTDLIDEIRDRAEDYLADIAVVSIIEIAVLLILKFTDCHICAYILLFIFLIIFLASAFKEVFGGNLLYGPANIFIGCLFSDSVVIILGFLALICHLHSILKKRFF